MCDIHNMIFGSIFKLLDYAKPVTNGVHNKMKIICKEQYNSINKLAM